jgi:hypothetical protein
MAAIVAQGKAKTIPCKCPRRRVETEPESRQVKGSEEDRGIAISLMREKRPRGFYDWEGELDLPKERRTTCHAGNMP